MATYLVAIVLCVLLVRGIIYIIPKLKDAKGIGLSFDKINRSKYLASFVSGVLFANAVPHFVHGISGEYFPAPFGQFLGKGLPGYLSNVIWGFINIVLGYNLFVIGKVSSPGKLTKIFFFAGILAMSIFLSVVFSHFNQ
jgi:hypothetical protein